MPATPKALKSIGFAVTKLAPYRCYSPTCKKRMRENPLYMRAIHYLHSPIEHCSHCGENHYWQPLAIIHLLQEKRQGIIIGKEYDGPTGTISNSGERFEFLCEKAFKGYRELPKSPNQPQHYVRLPEAATCYDCLKQYNKDQHPLGNLITENF